MSDATASLIRAIGVSFADFGGIEMERIRSRDWASGTFIGTRHELTFSVEGAEAEKAADIFLRDLGDAEFALRGHILADIALVSRERADRPAGPRVRLSLEALTVADL